MAPGRPAKKYSQAARIHDLVRMVESRHGVTVDECAEELGVTRRTVYRDLAAIQEAGYPLVSEWDNGCRRYRFLTGFKQIPPIAFTLEELMALHFFRSQLNFLKGTPFAEDLQAIFRKVNSVLPPRYVAHMERIARVSLPLFQGERDYAKIHEPLRMLREALLYQYRISIQYDSKGKGEPGIYSVDPYTLLFYRNGLYLLGYANNRGGLRTFALERMIAVVLEKERFELPDGYLPEDHLRNSFGIVEERPVKVMLRFSPVLAHMVRERKWHPTQRVSESKDGHVIMEFEAGGRMEIVSWILSHGRHVEVLSPADLREEIRAIAEELVGVYGS